MNPVDNWTFEKQSAYLYRVLSNKEKDPGRKQLFAKLAEEAEKQAAIWESKLTPGMSPTHFHLPVRARVTALLIHVFGPRPLRRILAAMKVRGMSVYQGGVTSHAMPHQVSEVGNRHHKNNEGNWLRASVFGVNDGLVSNASLILGVIGASVDNEMILLSGTAGMLAGAFSMACGEYVSVRSQREYFEKQIAVEKEELEQYPDEEAAELALIFEARGIPKAEAELSAKQVIANPEKALETLAREELGVNPDDLGSPWVACFSSFFSFLLGAFVPLVPYLWSGVGQPAHVSMGLSAGMLFVVGASLSLFTGRSALWSGTRMLALGAFAGACTFYLGRLLS